jgi:F0F1-type ATP synthase membrane subunit b/b'
LDKEEENRVKKFLLACGFASLLSIGCAPAPPPDTKANDEAAKKMEEAAKKIGEAADKMQEAQDKAAKETEKAAKEAAKVEAAVKDAVKGITDDLEKAKEAAKP